MNFVLLSALAEELGMDRSGLRKFIVANGFETMRVRAPGTRGSLAIGLSIENAQNVKDLRESMGFTGSRVAASSGPGWFYIVQPLPEIAPSRIKMGYATTVQSRLMDYRTLCPNAHVLVAYRCKLAWEVCAMDAISLGCSRINGSEVYDVECLSTLLQRAKDFFAMMPLQEESLL